MCTAGSVLCHFPILALSRAVTSTLFALGGTRLPLFEVHLVSLPIPYQKGIVKTAQELVFRRRGSLTP